MIDMNEYWQNRRTVRNFTTREVTDSTLRDIIEDATHAPNTGNMQLYSVVVTRDAKFKEALAPSHFSQPAMTGAPVLLTVCADCHRFVRWCEVSDANPGFDNFQSFVAAMIDAVIFAQQIVTIAETRGLGCCYLGTTTYNAPDIAATLKLPKMVVPIVTIAMGYPKGVSEVSDRLPVEAIMHNETYGEASDDMVRTWYAGKEGLPENVRFVEENGKQTLAQVYTDVRYPKDSAELFSRVFADFIDRAGFTRPE